MNETSETLHAGQGHSRGLNVLTDEICHNLKSMTKSSDYIIHLEYLLSTLAPIRICCEAGIFRLLAQSRSTISATELAQNLEGVPKPGEQDLEERAEFVTRMLRLVCAVKLADEAGPSLYRSNELTQAIAEPGLEAGFMFLFDNNFGPQSTMSNMVSYSKENGYKAPPTAFDGPFQRARDIVGTSTFQHWIDKDPVSLSRLSASMQRIQRGIRNWSAWFPAEAIFGSEAKQNSDRVFFVDFAGGFGHDLSAFAAKYPDQQARFVLQDLPNVIDEGEAKRVKDGSQLDSRIELSKHDFFHPQPIKAAKIYYMHKILHDWPDLECVQILKGLKDAMAPDSRIFVNDVILLEQGNPLL